MLSSPRFLALHCLTLLTMIGLQASEQAPDLCKHELDCVLNEYFCEIPQHEIVVTPLQECLAQY